MSNHCDFYVIVKGAEADLHRMTDFLSTGVEKRRSAEGYLDRYVLDPTVLFPNEDTVHDWIALEPADTREDSFPNEDRNFFRIDDEPDPERPERRALRLRGWSEACPPLNVVALLSKRFPEVEVEVGGTLDDYTFNEHWTGAAGRLRRIEAYRENIWSDTQTWYVKDGVPLEPGWEEHGVVEV
jgi:hypothetical protein